MAAKEFFEQQLLNELEEVAGLPVKLTTTPQCTIGLGTIKSMGLTKKERKFYLLVEVSGLGDYKYHVKLRDLWIDRNGEDVPTCVHISKYRMLEGEN